MSKNTEKLTLFEILNHDPYDEEARQKVDWDAVISAAQQNPDAVDSNYIFRERWGYEEYAFPLHQAIKLGAPVNVIAALCSPKALQHKLLINDTALHLALWKKSHLSVLRFLLEKQPDAIREKNSYGDTPLHYACDFRAPVKVVSLLLDQWPDATKEKNNYGNTPLHEAANYSLSFELILLLINQWPEATIYKNEVNQTPFDIAQETTRTLENTITLLSHVSAILCNSTDTHTSPPKDIMTFFVQIMWWKGVRLLLNRHPLITKTMDLHTNIMADFFSVVGHHCSLKTMWEVLRNEQDLLADV